MTLPLSTEGRRLLRTTAHDFGAVVAVALIGALVGAVLCAIIASETVGMTGNLFAPIGSSGMAGAVAGGFIMSGVLAVSAFRKGLRRKLVRVFRRASRTLVCCAALGGCSILTTTYLVFLDTTIGDSLASSPAGNIALLVTAGAGFGVAAGVALGLIVVLLTLLFMAAVALARMSAGFLRPASKGPGAQQADPVGSAGTPWPIQTAAALMPPEAGQRWRDDFDEARYDHEEDQYHQLLRDFLTHAPAVLVWAWITAARHHVIGASTSGRHR